MRRKHRQKGLRSNYQSTATQGLSVLDRFCGRNECKALTGSEKEASRPSTTSMRAIEIQALHVLFQLLPETARLIHLLAPKLLKKITGASQVTLRFLRHQQHASNHIGRKDLSYC
jgi:hypothetical protein